MRHPMLSTCRHAAAAVAFSVIAWALPSGASAEPETGAEADGSDAIRVVVGPSGKEPEPIAVPDLACGSGAKAVAAKVCADATAVLRRDLNLSGVFRVIDPGSYLVGATEVGKPIPFPDWFNVGARYLIEGSLGQGAKGPELRLRFYNVVDQKPIPFKLQKAPKGGGDLTLRIHRHVNAFMHAVTGRYGIFGSRILFTRKIAAGKKDIMQLRFGDPNPSRAVSNGTSNLFPSVGPRGRVLYTSFQRDKPDIYLGDELVTADDHQYRSARLSPRGDVYVVSVDIDGQSDLWTMGLDGELLENLSDSPEDEVSPRWTPDGGRIVYVSNRTGDPQIYMMAKDGSGARRISMAGLYNTSPDPGPGGRVVFTGMDDFMVDIFVREPTGVIQRITQMQGSNRDPTWSPDGRYLLFVSTKEDGVRLVVSTADGRWQFPLIDAPGEYSTPYWGH